jgi:hypothetical protein
MKEVSKAEFDDFIKNYPSQLEKNVITFCEPPALTYNDFSDGKEWPKSIVAKVDLYESFPKEREGQDYGWAPNRYYIVQEIKN